MANPVQTTPTLSPEWASDATTTVEPTLSERQAGWVLNQKPPAKWQNYWQRKVWQFLDIFHETLLKDWRLVSSLSWSTSTDHSKSLNNPCRHKEHFLGVTADGSEAGTGAFYKSIEGRVWDEFATPPIDPPDSVGSMSSNGSRIVMTDNATSDSFFSDDDGATWDPCIGPVSSTRAFFMPVADVWIGSDGTLAAMISSDGETFTSTGGPSYTGKWRNAEDQTAAPNTNMLLSDEFSDDAGTTWATQTNGTGSGYIYSSLIGEFIKFDNSGSGTELFLMSSTFGTWEVSAYADVIPGETMTTYGLFEMRGVLFAQIAGDGGFQLLLSRDLGLTWERVVTTSITNTSFTVTSINIGDNVGVNSEYVILTGYNQGPLTPPFAGFDIASVLPA